MDSLRNSTIKEDAIGFPPKIIAAIVVFWTGFANGIIVLCFIRNRQYIWTSNSGHILSLAVNDACLAVASLYMISLTFMSAVSQVQCSIAFYFYFSAQCAVLYNLFVICIHRALSIRMKTFNRIKPFFSWIMIFCAWFLSFVICAVPFVLWRSETRYPGACSAMTLFNEQHSAAKLLVLAYIFPLILTNILYVLCVLKLQTSLRKIAPVSTDAFESTTTNSDERQKAILKLHVRAVFTIGILLLIMDFCSVPLLTMYTVWWITGTLPVSRNIRYIWSGIFLMNSALNPFVYAGRTRHLREALKIWIRTCKGIQI